MKKRYMICIVILIVIAAISGIIFLYKYHDAKNEMAEYLEIQDLHTIKEFQFLDEQVEAPGIPGLPYKIVDFDALLKKNPDTVGWVSIPYSPIDYPVVQTVNNSKYLNTSFTGEKSRAGAVFVDANNNAAKLDQNTILYAHHLKNRTDMFASLLEYNDQSYYDLHQLIQFDTIYEQHGWWRVFAVIEHNSRSKDFNYLKLRFKDQTEFIEWVDMAKGLSLYETGVTVSPDDKVLTLSTCNGANYGRNGRQIIMAVKCKSDGGLPE